MLWRPCMRDYIYKAFLTLCCAIVCCVVLYWIISYCKLKRFSRVQLAKVGPSYIGWDYHKWYGENEGLYYFEPLKVPNLSFGKTFYSIFTVNPRFERDAVGEIRPWNHVYIVWYRVKRNNFIALTSNQVTSSVTCVLKYLVCTWPKRHDLIGS